MAEESKRDPRKFSMERTTKVVHQASYLGSTGPTMLYIWWADDDALMVTMRREDGTEQTRCFMELVEAEQRRKCMWAIQLRACQVGKRCRDSDNLTDVDCEACDHYDEGKTGE